MFSRSLIKFSFNSLNDFFSIIKKTSYIAKSLDFIYKIFGINIEVEKKENLMKNKSYILVANHQSSIDYIGIIKFFCFFFNLKIS